MLLQTQVVFIGALDTLSGFLLQDHSRLSRGPAERRTHITVVVAKFLHCHRLSLNSMISFVYLRNRKFQAYF